MQVNSINAGLFNSKGLKNDLIEKGESSHQLQKTQKDVFVCGDRISFGTEEGGAIGAAAGMSAGALLTTAIIGIFFAPVTLPALAAAGVATAAGAAAGAAAGGKIGDSVSNKNK